MEVLPAEGTTRAEMAQSAPQGIVVALDINGTIIDGDSIDQRSPELSLSLTAPAVRLIADITERISLHQQAISVVLYTLGRDWPAVAEQIEQISGGVITFDAQNKLYLGRARLEEPSDEPAVFIRQLAPDADQPFTYDGVHYEGPNPVWVDTGPALSHAELRLRTHAQHLVVRAVYTSGNPSVIGRQDGTLKPKLLVSELPVLVFDDHPLDWEVVSPVSRIVPTTSPANSKEQEEEFFVFEGVKYTSSPTDFCTELAQFWSDLQH